MIIKILVNHKDLPDIVDYINELDDDANIVE
jgi:hypothetical protein